MKRPRVVRGFAVLLLALALLPASRSQEKSGSSAIPIKELAPPPPKPTEGKHLVTSTPSVPSTTSVANVDMLAQAKLWIEAHDRNADKRLSKEEWPAHLRPGFARADANNDGFVSPEERQAYLSGALTAPKKGGVARDPYGVLAFRDLPYADTTNPRQRLDLYLPKEPKSDQPLPLVVFIHGGGWRNGNKSSGANQIMRFVQSGHYAAASIGYRLTDEAQWPAQIHDCKAAIRWLKAHAGEYVLNPDKIGVWGTSAGGHLVSMLGTSGDVKALEGTLGKHLDRNSRVACVVNYFGPENFLTMVQQLQTIAPDRKPEGMLLLLGGPVSDREAAAREASPVTHISADDPPFFTAHGTKDPRVPFAQAEELHAALQKAGVPSILQEMTNADHGFRSVDLDQRVMKFFDLHLRGESAEIPSSPIVFPAPNR